MATLTDDFKALCANLIVRKKESIRLRYRTLTKRLNTDFRGTLSETSYSRYVGSYGRNTAIDGVSDIDMLYQLPVELYHTYNAYSSNGQSALLQAVRNSIGLTYSSSKVGADGQVVVINFTDGIKFEVLPAFLNKDGKTFTHANTNNGGSWKVTDPLSENQAMRKRNAECNGNLFWLCRMFREWKEKNSVGISGVLIDTLAYRFIATWPYRDKSFLYYDWMTRDFLLYLSQVEVGKVIWKAPGSGRQIVCKGAFRTKANLSYLKALEAIKDEEKYPLVAKSEWKEIFGSKYGT